MAATFVTSIAYYSGLVNGKHLGFHHSYLLQFPPQLWRLATCFLVSGKKFDMLLDPYYMYQYAKRCELGAKFSKPGDFVTYIVFVCLTLLVGAIIPFRSFLSPQTSTLPAQPNNWLVTILLYHEEDRISSRCPVTYLGTSMVTALEKNRF